MNRELIICPGETIKELLDTYHYTQKDLAMKLDMELKTVNEILNGKGVITFDTAVKLGLIFDIDASFWNNLEFHYRKALKDAEEEEKAEKEYLKIASAYKELVKRGKIEDSMEKVVKIEKYKNFMEVANIDDISREYEMAIACRKAQIKAFNSINLMTWIQCGIKKTREIDVKSFDREKIIEMIPEIKKLTLLTNQKDALNRLRELCLGVGIIVSYEQPFPNTGINGIAKWITPDKAFIQVSDRGKRADTFWFTFMHELGHIMKGKKKEIFIDEDDYRNSEMNEERIANEFAVKELVCDKKGYERLCRSYDRKSVVEFAEKIGIDAGIVSGMLMHDTGRYNDRVLIGLRRELNFAEVVG